MKHTSTRNAYTVVYGRIVQYFVRPSPTSKGERYREPIKIKQAEYTSKRLAKAAAREWEALC